MKDFGTAEERAAALRVALACKELNTAILQANAIGVDVKVVDQIADFRGSSLLVVERMERRTTILPTALSAEDAA